MKKEALRRLNASGTYAAQLGATTSSSKSVVTKKITSLSDLTGCETISITAKNKVAGAVNRVIKLLPGLKESDMGLIKNSGIITDKAGAGEITIEIDKDIESFFKQIQFERFTLVAVKVESSDLGQKAKALKFAHEDALVDNGSKTITPSAYSMPSDNQEKMAIFSVGEVITWRTLLETTIVANAEVTFTLFLNRN